MPRTHTLTPTATALLTTLLLTQLTTAQTLPLPPLATSDFHVSDFQNDRIAVYDGSGTYLRSYTAPGLDGPRGIVHASNGQTYIASENTDEVFVFDANEQFTMKFAHADLDGPTGMAESPSGELFVASFQSAKVCVFALDGTFQRSITAAGLVLPNCVAFDSQGNLFVAVVSGAALLKLDANEQFVASMRPVPPVSLSSPMGVARDACDNMFVAGGGSNNIAILAPDGSTLGELSHPDLTGPQGVAFDERGHLFSSSFYTDRIVEFDADGNYVQTIQSGGLDVPRSIAFRREAMPDFEPLGCGTNPAGTFFVQSGTPVRGSTVTIGLDNPVGTQTPNGVVPHLLGSLRGQPNAPCGVAIPGFGMHGFGAAGELLIDVAAPFFVLDITASAWGGAGQPATASFTLPQGCDLVGRRIWLQGVLLDFSRHGTPAMIALTDGAVLQIR